MSCGSDVAPAPDEGEGAGGLDEAEAGPGAGAVGEQPVDVGQAVLGRATGGQDEAHGVVTDRGVDEDGGGATAAAGRRRSGLSRRAGSATGREDRSTISCSSDGVG